MTCIVGIVHKKKVYIGGDSAGVAGMDVSIRKDTKVFKVDNFVIGYTSSFRMGQLLRYSFHPPKIHADEDLFRYMCTSFVDALRNCFRSGGYMRRNQDEELGGTFLVGYKDRLFLIEADYQVGEYEEGYQSCGCGQDYALGALDAMEPSLPAEARIKRALEIASHRSAGVRPPFNILST